MVVQNRIQLPAQLLISRVVACLRELITQTKEAAYQRSTARCQKAKTLPSPGTADDCLGLVLQDHRFCRDATHGSSGGSRRVDVPDRGLSASAELLDCLRCRRYCRRRPATSEAAHVPTLSPRNNGYGCGATMTSRAVVDKITKAMQSSAPMTTASVEMPPALSGASS